MRGRPWRFGFSSWRARARLRPRSPGDGRQTPRRTASTRSSRAGRPGGKSARRSRVPRAGRSVAGGQRVQVERALETLGEELHLPAARVEGASLLLGPLRLQKASQEPHRPAPGVAPASRAQGIVPDGQPHRRLDRPMRRYARLASPAPSRSPSSPRRRIEAKSSRTRNRSRRAPRRARARGRCPGRRVAGSLLEARGSPHRACPSGQTTPRRRVRRPVSKASPPRSKGRNA